MRNLLNVFVLLLMVILVIGNISANNIEDSSIIDELNKQELKTIDFNFDIKTFNSCENIEDIMGDYIEKAWENNKKRGGFNRGFIGIGRITGSDTTFNDSITESTSSNVSSKMSTDFSKTNTQVDGVDESEIVKTDGEYIYYYNELDKYVYIVKADNLKIIKKIKLPDYFYSPVLYIGKNKLTIISMGYSSIDYSKSNYFIDKNIKTYTIVFDIKNVKNPILTKLYVADGALKQTRKIGDLIYIISSNDFFIPYYNFKTANDIKIKINKIMPTKIDISRTNDKNKQNLKFKNKKLPYNMIAGNIAKCNEIEYILPDIKTIEENEFNPSYNIISILDTKNTDKEVKTKIIAGSSSELYMSLENLYLTSNLYQNFNFKCSESSKCIKSIYPKGNNTIIHKVNIKKDNLKYQDSIMIPGSPLTQYSMDEYKGDFRILTKINNWTNTGSKRYTNLYILDENLKMKGGLEKLGQKEEFKSSRYIGDKLYLITFDLIDPLFVIDMSDSYKPKILGELKIPGYSTYLHPYDENHLIGIGYDTSVNKWGGLINEGVKIDLYEIDFNRKPIKKSKTWNDEIQKLIKGGCKSIEIDEDGNICEINKEKNDYNICTEKLTTKKLELPVCISGNFQSNYGDIYISQKYSYILGDRGSYSEALINPRMFIWKKEDNKLFLPININKNDKNDKYKIVDFFQGLVAIDINKNKGIKEDYRISHFNISKIEKERKKECSKYTPKNVEEKCFNLIGGGEYCEKPKNNYVPRYCYTDSTIGEYIASKRWYYGNSYIKRAVWIDNDIYTIGNDLIQKSNIYTGIKKDSVVLGK